MKCTCGFKFSGPGEFRNCNAFITADEKSGIICPKCLRRYVSDDTLSDQEHTI
jgi:hypothetical protein